MVTGDGTFEREMVVSLSRHPWTPADAVGEIAVRVQRRDMLLTLAFTVDGDVEQLRIPPSCPPRLAHQLWEHTCFEAFIAATGAAEYHELNLAPSGEWAAYVFRSYREIAGIDETLAPAITVQRGARRLELEAQVALDRLLPAPRAALRLGLSAVVEARDGTLSYWSVHHPPGKPDFHHADALAVPVEAAAAEC